LAEEEKAYDYLLEQSVRMNEDIERDDDNKEMFDECM